MSVMATEVPLSINFWVTNTFQEVTNSKIWNEGELCVCAHTRTHMVDLFKNFRNRIVYNRFNYAKNHVPVDRYN